MLDDNRRLELGRLVAQGVEGLKPEILRYLPHPLSAPRPIRAEQPAADAILEEMKAEQDAVASSDSQKRSRAAAESYRVSNELLHAIHVTLLLRQPLLLTGDPGVGKTRFARALAGRLGVPSERIDVKTTTGGRDLLYAIDDVTRFRDAAIARADASGDPGQSGAVKRARGKALRDYVSFEGLGRAIMRAAGPNTVVRPTIPMRDVAGDDYAEKNEIKLGELFPDVFTYGDRVAGGRSHTVVLIDEIDKAPRDTPNDLLVEIEEMVMNIRELGIVVRATPHFWPIVVITSNSERTLPDPFLRRCIFHNLKLDDALLPQIVAAQLPDLPSSSPMVDQVTALFLAIRKKLSLDKSPSTAELVGTIALLVELGFDPAKGIDLTSPEREVTRQQVAAALGKITGDKSKIADFLRRSGG